MPCLAVVFISIWVYVAVLMIENFLTEYETHDQTHGFGERARGGAKLADDLLGRDVILRWHTASE